MKRVFLVFLAVLLAVPGVFAATYTVCSSGCNYTTITNCLNYINNTADNTCNIIESGTYTISGAYTYYLTAPTWGPTPLVRIAADNTVLDCNGATFIGQDTWEQFEIDSENSTHSIEDTTIKNCNFKHFWNPIKVYDAYNPTITNNEFESCGISGSHVIDLWYVNGGRIENNTFLNTQTGGYPIRLAYSTNDTTIKNNYINGGRKGIVIFTNDGGSRGIQIINNTIIGMDEEGVYCWGSANFNSTIANNTIKNCESGIQMSNSSHEITGNKIDNTTLGMVIAGADNIIYGNYITNSIAPWGIGIFLWLGVNKNNNITGNTIINATNYGIVINSDSTGNFIFSNIIERANAAGLVVLSSNNTMSGNIFSYNSVAISINSSGNTLIDNILNYNNNGQLNVSEGVNVTIISLTIGSPVENYYLSKGNNTLNLFNSNSAIEWNNSTIDLTGNYGLNLYLGSKFVSLNSANLPDLNTKANVTFNDITCDDFKLWHSSGFYNNLADIIANGAIVATNANIGGDCTNTTICRNVQCSANTLIFEAQHFDGFGGESGPNTGSGNVSINLTEEVSITVKYNIAYGEGLVDSDKSFAVLDSSLTDAVNGTWTYTPQYLYIENDGTVNISVNLTSSKNASSFIGGTGAELKARGIETELSSCTGTLQTTLFEIFTTSQSICSLLQFGNSFDTFNVSTRLLIPSDAPSGYKESVLTFTAKKV